MRICSRMDCPLNGKQQSSDDFYKGRSECKTCSRKIGLIGQARSRYRRRFSQLAVEREQRMRLPGQPWRDWITRQIEAHGGAGHGGVDDLAAALGVSERVLWRWLHQSDTVDLDAVDRALCAAGCPWVLRELYQHLYQFEDVA